MKAHNAVIGMKVQVKRDCHGHSNEFLKKGLVGTIQDVRPKDKDYQLKVAHPDLSWEFAWVNASDVRRYITQEPIIKLTKGTKVRVKSTVVGKWGEKLQEGDVYILQGDEDISSDGTDRRIDVKAVAGSSAWITQPKYFDVLPDEVPEEPHVMGGTSYTSRKKYLTKVDPKPVRPDLSSLRVGDYIVANDTDPHLQEGVAYRVVQADAVFPRIALFHSGNLDWRKGYYVVSGNVAKILREVDNATSRVVKSSSESTCRSE